MAEPSKLDRTPNINARFNNSGEVDQEKRIAQYQLTPEERKQITDLSGQRDQNTAKEIESFRDQGEFDRRFKEKYAELAQRNNTPTPEHFPPGMRSRTLPKHNLAMMADEGVKQDHANRLSGFNTDYRRGVNQVLDRAAEQGRGPQPPQQRDQNRERGTTQDFNRANDNQPQQGTGQDFNRAANDQGRDRER